MPKWSTTAGRRHHLDLVSPPRNVTSSTRRGQHTTQGPLPRQPSAPRQRSEGVPIAHGRISEVQIGMLGPFEVRTDDGVLADVPGPGCAGLLIALALEPGRVVPKATLVDWILG